jgi:hypothetical protein
VDPDQEGIVHHPNLLQELHIPLQLLRQQRSFLRAKLKRPTPIHPILVLEYRSRILLRLLFRIFPAKRTSLQIIRLVNISMRGEEVIHDHKMNLSPSRKLDTMKSIEPGEEGMRVVLDVGMVVFEDRT